MKASVLKNFVAFSQPLEGLLTFMYTDSLGLVTTGLGNLIDPVSLALPLPWRNPDGSLADQATVEAQWQAVKDGPVNSSVNAGYLSTIRLDAAGIQQLVSGLCKALGARSSRAIRLPNPGRRTLSLRRCP